MQLIYPINLVGYEEGNASGDVITKYGEYLGTWTAIRNSEGDVTSFQFIALGEEAPRYSQRVSLPGSGLHVGLALREICIDVGAWHEENERALSLSTE
jgi:hypothetical protein